MNITLIGVIFLARMLASRLGTDNARVVDGEIKVRAENENREQ